MELTQSKSILAKLMATENLHIEQRNVPTASFDVENRILTIPVLDKNISSDEYDLFLGHEVAHALYTPLEGLKHAFNIKLPMSVMNVIEDSRIERKIKQKYPGIRHNFIRAYKELVRKNFFGTQGVDINKLNFIDRVNLYCKGGVELGISFTEDEKYLLDEIESTQTYEDVITVCKKVVVFMKEQQKQKQQQKKLQKQQKQKQENEETVVMDEEQFSSNDEDFVEDDSEDENNEQNASSGSNQGSGSGDSDKEDVEYGENASNSGDEEEDELPEPIESATDKAYRQNEDKLFSKDGTIYYYGNVPKLKMDKIIVGYKELWSRHKFDIAKKIAELPHFTKTGTNFEAFQKFRNDSKNVVSYLVKEFELRKNADQLKRATTAKTGELNMNKIYSYTFAEDLFKKVTVVPGGKSHGLVMFIDWSGSMWDHIDGTIRQLLNLVMFCKKINIPYEVYAFTDNYSTVYHSFKKNDMIISGFNLMNLLSSKMNASEFSYASSALLAFSDRFNLKPDWFSLSGTPLNESVIAAMEIVPKFRKENKLQVVNTVFLTDGEGSRQLYLSDGIGSRIYPSSTRKGVYVIRDNVTKHEVHVDSNCTSRELTAAYLELMKRRTNCHVVGFFILNGRQYTSVISEFYGRISSHEYNDLKTEFRNKKYAVVTSSGYDEYYLLKSESLDMDEDAEFEVKDNATTRGFVSAFTKFNNNKKTSRVVLNRFIGMIV